MKYQREKNAASIDGLPGLRWVGEEREVTRAGRLFDLDGTLTDPKLGITRSIQHALRKRGLPVPDADSLAPCIGPPLEQSFRERFG